MVLAPAKRLLVDSIIVEEISFAELKQRNQSGPKMVTKL